MLTEIVADLTYDVQLLKAQAVIEDYFTVNQEDIAITGGVINHLANWCVEAGYIEVTA